MVIGYDFHFPCANTPHESTQLPQPIPALQGYRGETSNSPEFSWSCVAGFKLNMWKTHVNEWKSRLIFMSWAGESFIRTRNHKSFPPSIYTYCICLTHTLYILQQAFCMWVWGCVLLWWGAISSVSLLCLHIRNTQLKTKLFICLLFALVCFWKWVPLCVRVYCRWTQQCPSDYNLSINQSINPRLCV